MVLILYFQNVCFPTFYFLATPSPQTSEEKLLVPLTPPPTSPLGFIPFVDPQCGRWLIAAEAYCEPCTAFHVFSHIASQLCGRWAAVIVLFSREDAKAQRDSATRPRSHSQSAAELGFEPRQFRSAYPYSKTDPVSLKEGLP